MNKTVIKIAIVLCIAIPVVNALALLTGFASNNPLVYVWPGFFVTLLFLIGKEKTLRDCGNIVCSGIVGIIWSLLGGLLIGVLSGVMPTLAALSLGVGIMVFLFAALMGPLPMFFNNYGFLFYLVAACFSVQLPIEWICSTVIIGAIYMFLVFGGIKLLCGFDSIELTIKKTEKVEDGED